MATLRIEKLQRGHGLDAFDCGREALNRFLMRYAFQNQQAGASQTYVAMADEEVAGYYTLVVGQIEYSDAPERLTKGLARHPVPIMLLARLAARGRDFERVMDKEFLAAMRAEYAKAAVEARCPVIEFDCEVADFREPSVRAGLVARLRDGVGYGA